MSYNNNRLANSNEQKRAQASTQALLDLAKLGKKYAQPLKPLTKPEAKSLKKFYDRNRDSMKKLIENHAQRHSFQHLSDSVWEELECAFKELEDK